MSATTKIRAGLPGVKTAGIDPTTGTWDVGDVVWSSLAASGVSPGRICTTQGTMGTLIGCTISTTSGLTAATVAGGGTAGMETGQFITIAGVSGIKRIVGSVDGSLSYAIELDTPADATVISGVAAFSPAAFTAFAALP